MDGRQPCGAIALLVAVAVAIAGCGGGPDPAPAAGAPSPAAPPSPAPVPPPPAPPAAPPPAAPPAAPAPAGGAPAPAAVPEPVAALPAGYRLVWQDEFGGAALDPTRWRFLAGPRGDAVRTPDAATVEGGVLRFTTYTDAAGVHRTGFVSTEGGLFEAVHGYFEARIRFRGTPGQWCAFWLHSPTIGVPLGDPARAGTEIDVVEHRFTDESGWQLADWVGQNVLWDGYGPHKKNVHHVSPLPGGAPVQGQWHTFAVLWDETSYTFYVDDAALWSTSAAVSQRSEYLLLTCEVLDAEWAGFVPPGGYGPRSSSTTGMDVDWVRVWQR
jgi:beta-glucanase (GH16 family)